MKILLKSNATVSVSVSVFVLFYQILKSDFNMECLLSRLLYAVFVVSSENVTVAELATTLQADLSQLQAAASFVCRLGWATKVIDPTSILQDISFTGSSKSFVSDEDASHASFSTENMLNDNDSNQQGDPSRTGNYGHHSAYTRVALIVDATITSYLMMGSVSPGSSISPFFFHSSFVNLGISV